MEIFEVRGVRERGRIRVEARGELDLATESQLRACVREHVQGYTGSVMLDLRAVAFIDSTGIRLLLTLTHEARRNGWTLTIVPSDAVHRLIAQLGLENRLLAPALDAVGEVA